ncbi:hypothetical protein [Diaphorobacter nitroreducens]|uniref:hypothetical protein n=1 Tax=Diaphorobacter nitroreducens TaxID=164759 RepID=UPI001650FEA1|nr:hypothetical protein [Diaphorobacter nitroreducens]
MNDRDTAQPTSGQPGIRPDQRCARQNLHHLGDGPCHGRIAIRLANAKGSEIMQKTHFK